MNSDKNQNDFWAQQNYDFGQFDYTKDQNTFSSNSSFYQPAPNNAFVPPPQPGQFDTYGNVGDQFADEPPLLEELGINFEHIMQKTVAVLNPLKQTDANILQDADLAGPLVFGLAFGSLLLLSGKVHFSYIYGFGVLGCILIYCLLTLMSPPNITFSVVCTVSILGYCLLPMVFLSAMAVFVSLNTVLGMAIAFMVILWCALSSSKLFVTALSMHNQQALIAYPCMLFYGVFALLALF
ncbi:hypothetical protein RDWZM_009151 [Blomia tropicalis]|uniref:Protein YIPF n=1 Tax=Blomia tropicalis TaxID=40697 RepID=A0A9Q0M2U1_BLOTA|nr:Protein yipf5 [Blomia tropicalis]KAJ6217994.1 hypothetical protein RDWZM_009151 [Blomia tropicalis]